MIQISGNIDANGSEVLKLEKINTLQKTITL